VPDHYLHPHIDEELRSRGIHPRHRPDANISLDITNVGGRPFEDQIKQLIQRKLNRNGKGLSLCAYSQECCNGVPDVRDISGDKKRDISGSPVDSDSVRNIMTTTSPWTGKKEYVPREDNGKSQISGFVDVMMRHHRQNQATAKAKAQA
jgi:hypothetical protein